MQKFVIYTGGVSGDEFRLVGPFTSDPKLLGMGENDDISELAVRLLRWIHVHPDKTDQDAIRELPYSEDVIESAFQELIDAGFIETVPVMTARLSLAGCVPINALWSGAL